MRKAPLAHLLLLALVIAPIAGPSDARADDHCKEAKALLGPKWVAPKTDAACKKALEAAEEEQWQLWLDLAFAEEATGNLEEAVSVYQRFIKSTLRRGDTLPAGWVKMREEATFTVARLEDTLTKTRGRITILTIPEGKSVRFTMEPRRGEEVTPLTRYLPEGMHIVVATDPDTGRSRELSFSVEVGQKREIKLDLRANTPLGVVEKTLPGDLTGSPRNDGVVGDGAGTPGVHLRMDDDKTPPPRGGSSHGLRRVGFAAIGVGVAASAIATGFLLNAQGLNDESDCAGALCDAETAALARARNDASISEDRALAGFITGGVFIVGGAIALIIDSLDDGADKVEVSRGVRLKSVAPMVGSGGAGLGATVGF